jgi:Type VI secretion, TssG
LTKIETIAQNINQVSADVRAEVLLAQAMEIGLQHKQFNVQCDGYFYRNYVHDLYKLKVDNQTRHFDFLLIQLSRLGLYDVLPEGLFFQPTQTKNNVKDAMQMVNESRTSSKKEIEIRKFFAPYEHEFFLHTLQNEQVESNILQGLKEGWLKEYFIDFWELPQNIPTTAALILVMFLPYVHRIAGDISATQNVLQKILNETVEIKLVNKVDTNSLTTQNILGTHLLGVELTCGQNFAEQYPVLQINVGPLQKSKAHQYVMGGSCFNLLQTFYNYFVPANTEVETTILLKTDVQKLILNQYDDAPILGMSSFI